MKKKKKDPTKGSWGWFQSPDGSNIIPNTGDPEAMKVFNNSTNSEASFASEASGEGTGSVAMGESYSSNLSVGSNVEFHAPGKGLIKGTITDIIDDMDSEIAVIKGSNKRVYRIPMQELYDLLEFDLDENTNKINSKNTITETSSKEVGHGLSRQELVKNIRKFGKNYKFDKYSDQLLFNIYNRLYNTLYQDFDDTPISSNKYINDPKYNFEDDRDDTYVVEKLSYDYGLNNEQFKSAWQQYCLNHVVCKDCEIADYACYATHFGELDTLNDDGLIDLSKVLYANELFEVTPEDVTQVESLTEGIDSTQLPHTVTEKLHKELVSIFDSYPGREANASVWCWRDSSDSLNKIVLIRMPILKGETFKTVWDNIQKLLNNAGFVYKVECARETGLPNRTKTDIRLYISKEFLNDRYAYDEHDTVEVESLHENSSHDVHNLDLIIPYGWTKRTNKFNELILQCENDNTHEELKIIVTNYLEFFSIRIIHAAVYKGVRDTVTLSSHQYFHDQYDLHDVVQEELYNCTRLAIDTEIIDTDPTDTIEVESLNESTPPISDNISIPSGWKDVSFSRNWLLYRYISDEVLAFVKAIVFYNDHTQVDITINDKNGKVLYLWDTYTAPDVHSIAEKINECLYEADSWLIAHDYKDSEDVTQVESLNEELYPVPDYVIEDCLNLLRSYQFKLDPDITHENPQIYKDGHVHIQVINTNVLIDTNVLDVRTVNRKMKEVIYDSGLGESLVHSLDQFEKDFHCPLTYSFGLNKSGYITAGLDIWKCSVPPHDDTIEVECFDMNGDTL